MNHQIMKISPELLEMMGSKLPNSLQPFSREIFLLDIIVAGTSYCKKSIRNWRRGLYCECCVILRTSMMSMPSVFTSRKIRIGWVPRELNLIISRLMDAGKSFFCRVEGVELVNDYWVKIDAKIYMVE